MKYRSKETGEVVDVELVNNISVGITSTGKVIDLQDWDEVILETVIIPVETFNAMLLDIAEYTRTRAEKYVRILKKLDSTQATEYINNLLTKNYEL